MLIGSSLLFFCSFRVLAEQEITSLSTLHQVLQTLHTKHGAPHILITSVSLPPSDLDSLGISTHSPSGQPLMLLIGSSYLPAATAQLLGGSKGSAPSTPSLESNFTSELGEEGTIIKPWFIQFPEVEGYFSGVGDTFAALTLGRFDPKLGEKDLMGSPSPIARATELAIGSLQGILANTTRYIEETSPVPSREEIKDQLLKNGGGKREAEMNQDEIEKLVQSQLKVEIMRRRELRMVQSRKEIENPQVRYRARWLEKV